MGRQALEGVREWHSRRGEGLDQTRGSLIENTPPCASAASGGVSNGGIITVPLSTPALSAMSSALSTRKSTFPCTGTAITTVLGLLLQQSGASRASVFGNRQPLLGVLLGVLLLC
jgi:hypothetical protein